MSIWYLDTSAVAKLMQPEAETAALRRWLRDKRWTLSDLHRTELRRAAGRSGPRALARADRLLQESDVIRLTPEIFDGAGRLPPAELRSLDALHLSAARALGPDLAGVVAYDERLAEAAGAAGLQVRAPGAASGR